MIEITRKELIKRYFDFFKSNEHGIIESASLIPENDPTVLFTTAGMHPLVPYLMGEPHPLGKRVANVQKCIRTGDIDEVGDESHLTFFEMLGNWSFGDYFKKEAIKWSYEFLTKKLGFNPEKLNVTCFEGDDDAPKDEFSASVWHSLGIPKERIFFLPKKDNWWGPAGETGPCGPDTEMFIDTGKKECNPKCKPGCGCGKYFEIWNDVFMEFNKISETKFVPLSQQNVDTGMGVERTVAMMNNKNSVYEIETFLPIVNKIKELSKINEPNEKQIKSIRIIADHVRAATFVLGDDKSVSPNNVDQGYILRRFIRRSIRHGLSLGINNEFLSELAKIAIDLFKKDYDELERNRNFIIDEIKKEDEKFRRTLKKGLREFSKLAKNKNELFGKDAFLLFQSYGFPIEMTEELALEKNIKVDVASFYSEFEKHQDLSRRGAEKKFKGGLGDASEETKKLHTATHVLGEALRKILKNTKIKQKGSNITKERLRYDFSFDRKLTNEEKKLVEEEVNQIISQKLNVSRKEMKLDDAFNSGAQAEFGAKYPDKVTVYSVGDYSKEICMGPHVKNTSELGHFKIKKEESSSAGVRRIKAVLEN